jgi:hypothetical protein
VHLARRRRWIAKEDYVEGLVLTQLAPLVAGVAGATAAALAGEEPAIEGIRPWSDRRSNWGDCRRTDRSGAPLDIRCAHVPNRTD